MGGAEVALLNILAALRTAQPEWDLHLIVSGDGPLVARAKALGVSVITLRLSSRLARMGDASAGGPSGSEVNRLRLLCRLLFATPAIAAYVFKLRKTLRRLNPDIIHSNGFKMHILGALARPARTPLVWHVHDYVSSRPFMYRLIRFFQNRCSLVLANSDSVKRDIESVCGETLKVQTIYNAVDTSEFSPEGPRLDLDELSGLPSHPNDRVVRVGLLATFARWKGHEVFLRALSFLPADLPVRGYIVGGALYQTDASQYSIEELTALARQLGVSHRVGFTGFVERPAAAMRSLDIVVHASTQPEPFGLVIVEGMASGRAVIASESGGAAELIQTNTCSNGSPEISALSHAPGDAKTLAERITELCRDPLLRVLLGAAGRATAISRFNMARLAKELVPIYQGLSSSTI